MALLLTTMETILETNVQEETELTYEEQVEATPYIPADPDNEVEEQEATYTTVTRTKTWTPTGTQPVYQGVDQTKLIPLLTKALQEALERIEQLEADHAVMMNNNSGGSY